MKYLLLFLTLLVYSYSNGQSTPVKSEDVQELGWVVEENAYPIGGYEAYAKWFFENNTLLNSSDSLTEKHRVFIEFWVAKDSTLKDINLIRGIGEPYDREALRLVYNNPIKWSPASLRGKPIEVRIVIPIKFVESRKDTTIQKKRK